VFLRASRRVTLLITGLMILSSAGACIAGNLYSFGGNNVGQLGLGNTVHRYFPVQVSSIQDVIAVATGIGFSLALTTNGDVWSFGGNAWGSLGLGDRIDRDSPTIIADLSDAVAVSAGYDHSFVILANGDIYSFGANNAGQLGLGNTVHPITSPQKVSGISNVVAIAAGAWHSLFLTSGGDVYSCGWGLGGALGHGNTSNQSSPKKITALSDVAAIAAGDQHSLALLKNGDVYSFGRNPYGQLGLGDNSDRLVPEKIASISDVAAIEAGYFYSLILLENGDVYSFGLNEHGQLGHGDAANRNIPTKIATLSNVAQLAASGHSLVALSNGNVYSFGRNSYGQLGNGDTTERHAPTMITTLSGVVTVAAGGAHSLVLGGASSDSQPSAPSSLSATAASSNQINLAWQDNSSNEAGFKIERKTQGGSYIQIDSVSTDIVVCSDTGLMGSTTYCYRVRSYNAVGESVYSNEDCATTTTAPVSHAVSKPTTPSGSSSGQVGTSLSFSTGESTCSQGHAVQYQFDWDDGSGYSSWSSSTSASHTYSSARTYQVKVHARCSQDVSVTSGWSSAKTVSVSVEPSSHTVSPPDAPSGPPASYVGEKIYFSSNAETCNQGHYLDYQFDWDDGTTPKWTAASSDSHSFSHEGNYQVRVRVRCVQGEESEWSPAVQVVVTPDTGYVQAVRNALAQPSVPPDYMLAPRNWFDFLGIGAIRLAAWRDKLVGKTTQGNLYEEFYWVGVHYDSLRQGALRDSLIAASQGNHQLGREYFDDATRYAELREKAWGAADAVHKENSEAALLAVETIRATCQTTVKIGLAMTGVGLPWVLLHDAACLASDFAVDVGLDGPDEAKRQLATGIVVTGLLRGLGPGDAVSSEVLQRLPTKLATESLGLMREPVAREGLIRALVSGVEGLLEPAAERILEELADRLEETAGSIVITDRTAGLNPAALSRASSPRSSVSPRDMVESPIELRVRDSAGNVTGIVNGHVSSEASRAVYDMGRIIVYGDPDEYEFQIAGVSQGEFSVSIHQYTASGEQQVNATNISTDDLTTHSFQVNWEGLTLGGAGVAIEIDTDGDGIPERESTADSEFTDSDLEWQVAELGIVVGPNPVPSTGCVFWIDLSSSTTTARLMIFSAIGRLVFQTEIAAGVGRFPSSGRWYPENDDGVPLSNGPYVYVLIADGRVAGQGKMVIQR